MEMPRKFCPLYPTRKGGFRDLTERFVHDIVSYAFAGWAILFLSVVRLFVVGERFIRRSSGPSSVTSIIFIIREAVKTRRGLLSLRMT